MCSLDLVRQLGRVPAHEVQVVDRGEAHVLVAVLVVEDLAEPLPAAEQVVEDEGEPLGDGVVAEVAVLEGEVGADVREVLGVAGLVEQHAEVVLTALRQHAQVDLVRHAHRRAERARRLELAHLGVEVDVGLRVEVDAQAGQGAPQRRQQRVGAEGVVEPLGAPQVRQVGVAELRERDAQALADQPVHDALVEALRVREERLELGAQVVVVQPLDRAVELLVVRVAQTRPPGREQRRHRVSSSGLRCSAVAARRAAWMRSRRARSGSLACTTLACRRPMDSPSTVMVVSPSVLAISSPRCLVCSPR